MQEVTIGLGGAAGDGLDKSGLTIARTAGRLGLHLFAYNSYQSIIRGGHIWLRLRMGQEKVLSQGDHLNVLIALNQDTIERHAREVETGGAIIYNSDRLSCPTELIPGLGTLPRCLPRSPISQCGKAATLPLAPKTVLL